MCTTETGRRWLALLHDEADGNYPGLYAFLRIIGDVKKARTTRSALTKLRIYVADFLPEALSQPSLASCYALQHTEMEKAWVGIAVSPWNMLNSAQRCDTCVPSVPLR